MSSPLLSFEKNYEIKTLLGSGSFGVVNKIITLVDDPSLKKSAPQEYALKQIHLKKFPKKDRDENLENAKKEYNLLKMNLDHVITGFGSYFDQAAETFIFSMELFPQNLKTLIEKRSKPFSFEEYFPLYSDILKGN